MSCFTGHMHEYQQLSIDRFDGKNLRSTVYFLSHLHEDHTVGLDSILFIKRLKANKDILLYCSEVTKVLLLASNKFKHLSAYIKSIPMNTPTIVEIPDPLYDDKEKVTVTLLPAFHSPGSVMCLFEGSEGTVLYTGDFRWEHFDIEKMHHLRSGESVKSIKSIYIDSTFCVENLYIPSKQHCIDAVYLLAREWISQSPQHMVYISLRAQYGHELLLNAVAKRLNCKVHVSEQKASVYEKIQEYYGNFTSNGTETQIHACDKMCKIERNGEYTTCQKAHDPDKVMMILPTTMYFTQVLNLTLDKIVRKLSDSFYRACYSFHSSYTEIMELLLYLKPDNVYPNVKPCGDTSLAETQNRLNLMLKKCKSVTPSGDTLVLPGLGAKELGTLKTSDRGATKQKNDSTSDLDSLNFGTPVEQSIISSSPSSDYSITETADARKLSPQKNKEPDQSMPYQFLALQTLHADSQCSESEHSIVSSQKCVDPGASGEHVQWWTERSFLNAVNSSNSINTDSAQICLLDDNEQKDEDDEDVSQLVDKDIVMDTSANEQSSRSHPGIHKTDVLAEPETDSQDSEQSTNSFTDKTTTNKLENNTTAKINNEQDTDVLSKNVVKVGEDEKKLEKDNNSISKDVKTSQENCAIKTDDADMSHDHFKTKNSSKNIELKTEVLHKSSARESTESVSNDDYDEKGSSSDGDELLLYCSESSASIQRRSMDKETSKNSEVIVLDSDSNDVLEESSDNIILSDDDSGDLEKSVSPEKSATKDNGEKSVDFRRNSFENGTSDNKRIHVDSNSNNTLRKHASCNEQFDEELVNLVETSSSGEVSVHEIMDIDEDSNSKSKVNVTAPMMRKNPIMEVESTKAEKDIPESSKEWECIIDLSDEEVADADIGEAVVDNLHLTEVSETVRKSGNGIVKQTKSEHSMESVASKPVNENTTTPQDLKDHGYLEEYGELQAKEEDKSGLKRVRNMQIQKDTSTNKTTKHSDDQKVKRLKFTRCNSFEMTTDVSDDAAFYYGKNDLATVDLPDPEIYMTKWAFCFVSDDKCEIDGANGMLNNKIVANDSLIKDSLVNHEQQTPSAESGANKSNCVKNDKLPKFDSDIEEVIDLTGDDFYNDFPTPVFLMGSYKRDVKSDVKGVKKAIKISFSKNRKPVNQVDSSDFVIDVDKEADISNNENKLIVIDESQPFNDDSENKKEKEDSAICTSEWLSCSKVSESQQLQISSKQKRSETETSVKSKKCVNKNESLQQQKDKNISATAETNLEKIIVLDSDTVIDKDGNESNRVVNEKELEEKAELKRQAVGFICETDSDTDSDTSEEPPSPTGSVLYDEFVELSSDSDNEDHGSGSNKKDTRNKGDENEGDKESSKQSDGWLNMNKSSKSVLKDSDENTESEQKEVTIDKDKTDECKTQDATNKNNENGEEKIDETNKKLMELEKARENYRKYMKNVQKTFWEVSKNKRLKAGKMMEGSTDSKLETTTATSEMQPCPLTNASGNIVMPARSESIEDTYAIFGFSNPNIGLPTPPDYRQPPPPIIQQPPPFSELPTPAVFGLTKQHFPSLKKPPVCSLSSWNRSEQPPPPGCEGTQVLSWLPPPKTLNVPDKSIPPFESHIDKLHSSPFQTETSIFKASSVYPSSVVNTSNNYARSFSKVNAIERVHEKQSKNRTSSERHSYTNSSQKRNQMHRNGTQYHIQNSPNTTILSSQNKASSSYGHQSWTDYSNTVKNQPLSQTFAGFPSTQLPVTGDISALKTSIFAATGLSDNTPPPATTKSVNKKLTSPVSNAGSEDLQILVNKLQQVTQMIQLKQVLDGIPTSQLTNTQLPSTTIVENQPVAQIDQFEVEHAREQRHSDYDLEARRQEYHNYWDKYGDHCSRRFFDEEKDYRHWMEERKKDNYYTQTGEYLPRPYPTLQYDYDDPYYDQPPQSQRPQYKEFIGHLDLHYGDRPRSPAHRTSYGDVNDPREIPPWCGEAMDVFPARKRPSSLMYEDCHDIHPPWERPGLRGDSGHEYPGYNHGTMRKPIVEADNPKFNRRPPPQHVEQFQGGNYQQATRYPLPSQEHFTNYPSRPPKNPPIPSLFGQISTQPSMPSPNQPVGNIKNRFYKGFV